MFVLLALSVVAPVSAACTTPYSAAQLANDLQVVQIALRNLDDNAFDAAGRRLDAGLPCLNAVVPTPVFAAASRYIGVWNWTIPGDTSSASRWFRTALELDPGYVWDVEELENNHPVRTAWDQERAAAAAAPVVVSGKELAAPGPAGPEALSAHPDAKILLDGRPLTAPFATLDRPHIVQYVSGTTAGGEAVVAGSWCIDGNTFPADVLRDPPPVVVEPERKGRSHAPPVVVAKNTDGFDVIEVKRQRPPAKTPLLILGGLGVAAAGGVYGLALQSRGEFDAATTTEDVETLRARTNTLVLASGGAALLGVGFAGWGVVLDGGAALGWTFPL